MKLCLIPMALLASDWSCGQTLTQSVQGRVIDIVTRKPLVGATVIIIETDPILGGVTDLNGYYQINDVPVGRHDIEISFIGYRKITKIGALINSAKPYNLDIGLKQSMEGLKEIVITSSTDQAPINRTAKVSARSFTLEESQRFAGGLSDPSRVAYSFAGVTFGAPQDNGVVVRGNSPTNVLWRIEGVEVPGASHFGGGNLAGAGLITIYSANVLGRSDFLSGAFPAEYGNVTSGVFDINFRKGSTEENKYTGQLGVLGADIAVEGPLGNEKAASYLFNYRHGFIGYYGRLAGGVEPDFQDLSFNVAIPHRGNGEITLWGIGGLSSIFTPYGRYEVDDGEIERRETEGDFQQDEIKFDMAAAGVNFKWGVNEKGLLNSSVAITTNGYRSLTDWFTPDADTLNTGVLSPYTDIENRESKVTWTLNYIHQFSTRLSNQSGLILDFIDYNSSASQADRPNETLTEFLNTSGQTYYLQLYSQNDFQVNKNISIQGGVNISQFGINQETTVEPRVGLNYELLPDLTFGLGYGRHSRREEPKVYFFEYLDEEGSQSNHETLKRMKADHYVAKLDWKVTPSFRLNLEGYYQRLFDVPVVPDSSYSFINYTQLWELDEPLNNEGTGYNKGLDLSLEQKLRRGRYFLLTGSLFDSKFTSGDNIERNTLFNRNFLSTLTMGQEITFNNKKRNRVKVLGLNVNLTYMGGQRITPFIQDESVSAGEVILDYRRLYSMQTAPELWLNAGITYKINKARSTVTWGLDFQNATLLEQLQGYEYNFFIDQVQEERVLFLLPNFYYKIEF